MTLANNRLAPNQETGSTEFTISIGGEDQDFGDAPAPYPTLLLDNGASHVIDQGFYLGSSVDVEPNGIPSENATGDGGDENGVTFLDPLVPGNNVRVQVVASRPGFVDAWVDFDADGSWNGPGEKILSSFAVSGSTIANVAIPETTAQGVSFARFRLTREGGVAPTGLALNGEVEDYQVNFVTQLPWQNPSIATDVNNDGAVVPMDALQVINELNGRSVSHDVTGLLPNPPVAPNLPEDIGFLDVDGDGFVSPRDALLVINVLNGSAAEGEPTGPVAARAATAVDLTDAAPLEVDTATLDRSVLIAAAIDGRLPMGPITSREADDQRGVDKILSADIAGLELQTVDGTI